MKKEPVNGILMLVTMAWLCSTTAGCGGDEEDPQTPFPDGGTSADSGGSGYDDGGVIPDASEEQDAGQQRCTGSATPCYNLNSTDCLTAHGCHDSSDCEGSAHSCSWQSSRYSCTAIEGCRWDSQDNRCEGVAKGCYSFYNEYSCEDQPGCHWSEECAGSATPCSQLSLSACEDQPGCHVE